MRRRDDRARAWMLAVCVAVGSCGERSAERPDPDRTALPTGVKLQVGDMAPAFSLAGSDGNTYSLSSYAGKQTVVLAWFTKAFTAP